MQRRLSSLTFPGLLTGIALLLSACADRPAGPPVALVPAAPPAPTMPAEVRIAVLVPQTGEAERAATLGQALSNAATMAAEEAGDPTLLIATYDTSGTEPGARAAAERALAGGADLIIGPLFSAGTRAAAALAAPAGVRILSFSIDSAVAGPPVWVTGFQPEAEAARMMRHAGQQGHAAVAMFYPANDYGRAAVEGARRAASQGGPQLVAATAYPRSFKGIQDAAPGFAADLKSSGATAVLLPAGGQELRSVGAFLEYHGIDPTRTQYLGLGQWNARSTLGEQALQGGLFPAPDPDRLRVFADRYTARFGGTPPALAVLGYDAMKIAATLWAEARRDGRPDVFADAALTRPEGFDGALGFVQLLPGGQTERGMAVLRVGAEGFELVDPAPLASFVGAGS